MSSNDKRYTKRNARHFETYGHEWFFRLKGSEKDSGLEGYYDDKFLDRGIIMARDVEGRRRDYKMFAYFKSRDQVLEHMNNYPKEKHHFYELVGGTTREQKIYFDLDINPYTLHKESNLRKQAEQLVERTLQCTVHELKEVYDVDVHYKNISVYETKYPDSEEVERDDGSIERFPRKFSYHIVVQGYYFSSHEPMRVFGKRIKEKVDTGMTNCIDIIWDVTRQFRIMHSQKLNSNARKELMNPHPCWEEVEEIDEDIEFHKSFVSNVEGCIKLECK